MSGGSQGGQGSGSQSGRTSGKHHLFVFMSPFAWDNISTRIVLAVTSDQGEKLVISNVGCRERPYSDDKYVDAMF